jgi:F-type H+-transporting ATPase subunit delta
MKQMQQNLRDAKQLLRLCLMNGGLDENRVHQVVQVVSRTGNRNRFDVLAKFRRLLRLDYLRRAATVESVTVLSPDFQADIRTNLLQIYGPDLSVSFATNPALIGGMRIVAGSDVYDGSIRGRLATLEESFR